MFATRGICWAIAAMLAGGMNLLKLCSILWLMRLICRKTSRRWGKTSEFPPRFRESEGGPNKPNLEREIETAEQNGYIHKNGGPNKPNLEREIET